MLDLGVHMIDALRFILGDMSLVSASARTIVASRPVTDGGQDTVDVDDWSWGELELGNGVRVTVEASRIFLGAEGVPFELYGSAGSLVGDLEEGRMVLRRFDGREAEYRAAAALDPYVRAVDALRPPVRLSLGSFVDLHAAGLHHMLLRTAGDDPAPGLAPTFADAAVAETLAHAIVEMGRSSPSEAAPSRAPSSASSPRSPHD
jgi:predicted dehydrogenase